MKYIYIVFIILLFSNRLIAQMGYPSTTIVNANFEIYVKISIMTTLTEGTHLSFGKVSTSQGTVTVNPNDNSAAHFTIKGEPNSTFEISLPDQAELTKGSATMIVNNFNTGDGLIANLDAKGNKTFSIGATLEISDKQEAGIYDGTYPVTINYY